MGRIALLAWGLTAAVSYALLGGTLGRLVEGYDSSAHSILPVLATLLSVAVSLVLTIRWAGRSSGTPAGEASGRRGFLLGALGAAGGLSATFAAALARNSEWYTVTGRNIFLVKPEYKAEVVRSEWSGSKIASRRRLGRTEALVSDISLGSGSGTGGRQTAEVAREAIERGINYFDTAPDYSGSGSEQRLGEAMKGVRDRMFLATKFCLPTGHLGPHNSVEEYMEAVNGSLRRLQTDWVDLVHIHSCDSVERLMNRCP